MCQKCVHKIEIPGNYHVGCNNPPSSANIKLKQWQGCGTWPIAFDPAIVENCNNFSSNPENRRPVKKDPFLDAIRLLAGAGRL